MGRTWSGDLILKFDVRREDWTAGRGLWQEPVNWSGGERGRWGNTESWPPPLGWSPAETDLLDKQSGMVGEHWFAGHAWPLHVWGEYELALLSSPWPSDNTVSSKVSAGRRSEEESRWCWLSNLVAISRRKQNGFEARSQPTFRGQITREKPWSQTNVREHRPVTPASDLRSSYQRDAQGKKQGSQIAEDSSQYMARDATVSTVTPLRHPAATQKGKEHSGNLSVYWKMESPKTKH